MLRQKIKGEKPGKLFLIPDRFKEQVALVVGGAQGIGKAIAVRLAREGARLMIADIDRKKLSETKKEIAAFGGDVHTLVCDVRRTAQVQKTVRQTLARHRRVDILMYIAGVGKVVPLSKTTDRFWDDTLDINLKGAFLFARETAPHMIRRKRGKMVFMASTNSWEGEPDLAPYNASKAGLFLLGKTLARELGPHGINVNCVGPGFIRTRLTAPVLKKPYFAKKYATAIPLGRLGWPEDIAGPATFLASRDADYVNGVLLFVDGGQLA